jgi:uncharacterized protein
MSEESNLPRLTLDTNEVISGTISPGNYSSYILSSWQNGEFRWVQTPQTFQELQGVLQREKFRVRYGFKEDEIQAFLNATAAGALFVTPISSFELPLHSRDKKDDKFLACAFAGECDYLVTEDNDLLTLNGERELGKLQIVTAYDYLTKTGHL